MRPGAVIGVVATAVIALTPMRAAAQPPARDAARADLTLPAPPPAPVASPPADDLDNLGFAILGSTVGYALGVGVASLFFAVAGSSLAEGEGAWSLPFMAAAVLIGPAAGTEIAGDAGGEATGVDGSFWAALGGTALGLLAAAGVVMATATAMDSRTGDDWLGYTALITLPIVFSVSAYELTDDPQ